MARCTGYTLQEHAIIIFINFAINFGLTKHWVDVTRILTFPKEKPRSVEVPLEPVHGLYVPRACHHRFFRFYFCVRSPRVNTNFNMEVQKVSPCHKNPHFSFGKTEVTRDPFEPVHGLSAPRACHHHFHSFCDQFSAHQCNFQHSGCHCHHFS